MTIVIAINGQCLTDPAAAMLRTLVHRSFNIITGEIGRFIESGDKLGFLLGARRKIFKTMHMLDGEVRFKHFKTPPKEGETTVYVNNVRLPDEAINVIYNVIASAVQSKADGENVEQYGSLADLNALGLMALPEYNPFPRYPELPRLHAVDLPGYEYRDMRQSDLSRIHMDPPPPDDGWRRETLEMVGPTGRMMRKLPSQ